MSDRFAADLPKDVNAETRSSAGTTIARYLLPCVTALLGVSRIPATATPSQTADRTDQIVFVGQMGAMHSWRQALRPRQSSRALVRRSLRDRLPDYRARSRPANTRSRIIDRSNSENNPQQSPAGQSSTQRSN